MVVGGGITALEIVEGLRAHCRRVHYLLRGARYWSNVLDEVKSHAVLHHLARQGVESIRRRDCGSGGKAGPRGRASSPPTVRASRAIWWPWPSV